MDNKLIILNPKDTFDDSDKVTQTLSSYIEKIINDDKTVTYIETHTKYFIENNTWDISFFKEINQFKDIENKKNPKIKFVAINDKLNKELKFIVYNKIFREEWGLKSIHFHATNIKRIGEFLNIKYSNISSLEELDQNKVCLEWINWLVDNNISIEQNIGHLIEIKDKNKKTLNTTANFMKIILEYFLKKIDDRDEWDKDKWDIRILSKQYNITYSKTNGSFYIDFTKIKNDTIRKSVKKYIKDRLIIGNKFGWGSACQYMAYIPVFLNFICELEPTWNNLNNLNRTHIEEYIEWLHKYKKENEKQSNSNPDRYINLVLSTVENFLDDIQAREYDIAPIKNIRTLIRKDDKPSVPKVSADDIKYVPDYVLEQLMDNINDLPKSVVPVIYTMFKTGLRISDTLELTQNCLRIIDEQPWIITDIKKTNVKNHKIPIDDELWKILKLLVDKSKEHSNEDNNPDKYIFINYTGRRKGLPYTRKWIQTSLNKLADEKNIVDESGEIYHFRNHAFRHTYAVKLLANGVDIITIQELLAHASPEMTTIYAKVLDNKKREAFDMVAKQGVFSFDNYDNLKEEDKDDIPQDIMDMLYTSHKLKALDTPYGTCMQRTNGKCNYAKQPPCLTCNNGKPCKDLFIGAFEGDVKKYEILINSSKTMIENAKLYNREEMVTENEELLQLYENIHSVIHKGNIIYGRIDKLKKKE